MSLTKNAQKSQDKIKLDIPTAAKLEEKDDISCKATNSCTYAVTVSKKPSVSKTEDTNPCAGQKSFISIHSTDQLCTLALESNPASVEECNVEVLSLNEVFPSTSEESLTNDEESPVRKKKHAKNKTQKTCLESGKTTYIPTNSKSMTGSARKKELEGQNNAYSDFDIPKSTMYVVGSNPGEPKMTYVDPPKKISKTMKKFLRNMDKHKKEQNKCDQENVLHKLNTMRGILKDGHYGPECTGDSTEQGVDYVEDVNLTFPLGFNINDQYNCKNNDKNVKFNTQVVIIHFTGDLCVGQSVETLSKEKDQQARNSELRKTFLTKYNEFWPTQK